MSIYENFATKLTENGFQGDISFKNSERIVYSTDNSIYELKPNGILFPRNQNDVEIIFTLLQAEEYQSIKITARGGGTSTNGQSINHGFIVDYSRYMNKILKIDVENKTAEVEPAVILDVLNKELEKYGLFFPPNISPSNRATIGGMVNTDACGKGSCIYGRTSDHILDLSLHILNEKHSILSSKYEKNISEEISPIIKNAKDLCKNDKLIRTTTGYNVEKSINSDGTVNLNYLISGSEGTLALISKVIIKLHKIPARKRVILMQYKNFENALADARNILVFEPSAIETVDENVLNLARNDIIWNNVSHLIGENSETSVNIMEFAYSSIEEFDEHLKKLLPRLERGGYLFEKYFIIEKKDEIANIWDLRKKGVGLLGAMKGKRRPIPFVEDTIVPPEELALYIKGFRKILEKYGVAYGMFGHVDAGCLHVRPALDMRQETDRNLIRTITDEVVELLQKHNGILWGEHGKGFRGEYTEKFFGIEVAESFRKIKIFFDPNNQLNPNKIATPNGDLPKIDDISTRGILDEKIPEKVHNEFENILSCNGNALCFNFETNTVMCPSYKVTNDRVHSPKGRAMLFKEWVRETTDLPSLKEVFLLPRLKSLFYKIKNYRKKDFTTEVYDSFSKCLGCKACNTQCPIKVSIPDAKAYFLSIYFQTHFRTLQDYAIANVEKFFYIMGHFAKFSNFITNTLVFRYLTKKIFGIIEIPHIQLWNPKKHNNVGEKIVILQEAFTNYYHTDAMKNTYELLVKLGFNVHLSKIFENGKGLHAKGFLNQFRNIIRKNIQYLKTLDGIKISVEPSIALSYKDEYSRFSEEKTDVLYLPEFLNKQNFSHQCNVVEKNYFLILHCSEQTNYTGIDNIWKEIFKKFDINLNIVKLGCCGMSGSFGMETQNAEASKKLFTMHWESAIQNLIKDERNIIMVTGSSCKNQLKRFSYTVKNPIEVLNTLMS